MSLDALIMLLGTLVALMPFFGFPNSWDRVILLILGIFIVLLGIVVRRRGSKKDAVSGKPRVFGEEQRPEGAHHDAA
jgi:hypothetical protein